MRRQARRESSRAWIASGAAATPSALPDNDWIMMDGRPYFVAGYTSGGAPYGIYLDELDDDYLTGMITPGRPGKLVDLDLSGP